MPIGKVKDEQKLLKNNKLFLSTQSEISDCCLNPFILNRTEIYFLVFKFKTLGLPDRAVFTFNLENIYYFPSCSSGSVTSSVHHFPLDNALRKILNF